MIYSDAINAGIMPNDFWSMTLSEIVDVTNAFNRRRYDDIYDLSAMIKTAILSSFSEKYRFPEKIKETNGNKPVDDWKSSKAYMEMICRMQKGGKAVNDG